MLGLVKSDREWEGGECHLKYSQSEKTFPSDDCGLLSLDGKDSTVWYLLKHQLLYLCYSTDIYLYFYYEPHQDLVRVLVAFSLLPRSYFMGNTARDIHPHPSDDEWPDWVMMITETWYEPRCIIISFPDGHSGHLLSQNHSPSPTDKHTPFLSLSISLDEYVHPSVVSCGGTRQSGIKWNMNVMSVCCCWDLLSVAFGLFALLPLAARRWASVSVSVSERLSTRHFVKDSRADLYSLFVCGTWGVVSNHVPVVVVVIHSRQVGW